MKMKRYATTEESREGQEAEQREIAADLARKHGGKFRSARGNDAFGHPVLIVADAAGNDVAKVVQKP
jgi:hypothetical protein